MTVRSPELTVLKASDLPSYYNAVDILERNLAGRADKVALHSSDRNVTFQEASAEANRVGNALSRLGVQFGDVVGILAFDSAEWVSSFFGSLKIGAVSLGMNTLLTSSEFAQILRDSRAKVLIVQEALQEAIDEIRDEADFLEHVIVIGNPNQIKAGFVQLGDL